MAFDPESILDSIKKKLGLDFEYDVYDLDVITHINTVFLTLQQLGIGPVEGYMIEDASDMWDDFLDGEIRFNAVKSYMYLRVRMLFDPPSNSFTQQAMKEQIQEIEWRLNVEREATLVVPLP